MVGSCFWLYSFYIILSYYLFFAVLSWIIYSIIVLSYYTCFIVSFFYTCFIILFSGIYFVVSFFARFVVLFYTWSSSNSSYFWAPRIFKQILLDEFLYCHSTRLSSAELFCAFLTLDLLFEKNDCKQFFNIAFINSRPLASNYAFKEVDWSFEKYASSSSVKLNWLQ